MNCSNTHVTKQLFGLRQVVAGTVCCVLSSLGYTAANICMRQLAALVLFHEPMNQWLILGVAITILGVILIDRPEEEGEMAD